MRSRWLAALLAPSLMTAFVACGSSEIDGNATNGGGDHPDGGSNPLDPFGNRGDAGTAPGPTCAANLTGRVRDFRGSDVDGGHPDFETFKGRGPTTGLVEKELGADRKPVFASTTGDGNQAQLTGKAEFDQWYRDTPGVNLPFDFAPPLVAGPNGIATYATDAFFPIDGKGFGDSAKTKDGVWHNFSFTFELHLEFLYRGGEKFTFTGDDDLWTFINGHLAIDLGGLHPPESDSIDLDAKAAALGIEKGKVYPLDVFQAERAKFGSNFRIDTTLQFTNCDPIIIK